MVRRPRARRKIPRGTFWLGGFAGLALALPLVTLVVLGFARHMGVPDAEASIDRVAMIALVFAGLPALVSGGGVARVAAHRMAERGISSIRVAAQTMAVAGLGLTLLVALPEGELATHRLQWIPLLLMGALAGAATGIAIGILVGKRQARHDAPVEEAPAEPVAPVAEEQTP
jgi:hypothetical protein